VELDAPPAAMAARPDLAVVLREWGRIGCIGFGGPPTHIALLRALCVDKRGWMSPTEFEDAIAACNLLPGPASTQLAIYCGLRVRGRAGAVVGGLAFICPGLIAILALAVVFLAGSPPRWVQAAGAGAGAAVAAVAVQAGLALVPASWQRTRVIGRFGRFRWPAYLAAGTVAAATIGPWLVLVLLACGGVELMTYLRRATHPADGHEAEKTEGPEGPEGPEGAEGAEGATRTEAGGVRRAWKDRGPHGRRRRRAGGSRAVSPLPLPLLASAVAASTGGPLALIWVAFKVGALSYGGGFVIIPLMRTDAVDGYHWMTAGQFLNAVALGQITPGPVVHTVTAVGYAAFGIGGGLLAAAVAFGPSFVFVLTGGHHFDRLRGEPRVRAFLDGAGPAAAGAIFGSAVPLALTLGEAWQYAVLAGSAALLIAARRGVVLSLVAAAAAGVILVAVGAPLPG